jgi:flagellar basal body-associated protein FliL
MDKSKMMMIIIIALLVLLLGTVVGVGVYLISLADDDTATFVEHDGPAVTTILMPEDMYMVSLGERVTANLALGPNNRSDNVIFNVDVGLNHTVDASEFDEFYGMFNQRLSIARAEVLGVFLTRTYDEVRTREGRDETAEMIKYRLQEVFGSNLIVSVVFSDWNAVRGR